MNEITKDEIGRYNGSTFIKSEGDSFYYKVNYDCGHSVFQEVVRTRKEAQLPAVRCPECVNAMYGSPPKGVSRELKRLRDEWQNAEKVKDKGKT